MIFRKFFTGLASKEAEAKLREQKLIIRRSTTEGDSEKHLLALSIYSDAGEARDKANAHKNPPFYYTIAYKDGEKIRRFKFATFETDPEKISEKLIKKIQGSKDENARALQAILIDTPLAPDQKETSSELIQMHRDGRIRPEEKMRVSNILSKNKGFLILSTQTPPKKEEELKAKGAKPGGTGLEMQKLLSEAKPDQLHIIITGHGEKGGEKLGGIYLPVSLSNAMDIEFSADDYVRLLMEAGLKKGSHIDVVLNVCYGAEPKWNNELGDFDPGTSFAEQFIASLAKKGISATVTASTTSVTRFNGEYLPGEKAGEYMKFRAEDGFQNIRIFQTSEPDLKKVTCRIPDSDILIGKPGIILKSELDKAKSQAVSAAASAPEVAPAVQPVAPAPVAAAAPPITAPVAAAAPAHNRAPVAAIPAAASAALSSAGGMFQPQPPEVKVGDPLFALLNTGKYRDDFVYRPGKKYLIFDKEAFRNVEKALEASAYKGGSLRVAGYNENNMRAIEIVEGGQLEYNKEAKKVEIKGSPVLDKSKKPGSGV